MEKKFSYAGLQSFSLGDLICFSVCSIWTQTSDGGRIIWNLFVKGTANSCGSGFRRSGETARRCLQKEPNSHSLHYCLSLEGPPSRGWVSSCCHPSVQPEVTTPVLITPASITQSSEKQAPSYAIPLHSVLSPSLPAEATGPGSPNLPEKPH